ncbi:MAG: flavodoxin family protein [Sedimentisphaerales bacterium]|jgi:multimeric flavodoxin WrbA
MMKKILAVVGSPRKGGNTDLLVQKLAEGAVSKGAQVDTILLADLNIRECDGCHVCWKGKSCCTRDDMLGLYQKISESDAIVFGTPVYWFGPTAIMKAFIDRFVYFNCPENRVKIKGKAAATIIPFEDDDLETARPLVELFGKSFEYLEMRLVGSVIAGGVGKKGDILKKPDRLNEAYELGKRLAD